MSSDGTLCSFVCFFFFQAEDGIRDGHVTGVQTCALPICGVATTFRDVVSLDDCCCLTVFFLNVGQGDSAALRTPNGRWRSEERRVGKECGARGWREQDNENNEEDLCAVMSLRVCL